MIPPSIRLACPMLVMQILDKINGLLGDDLRLCLMPQSRVAIAASCSSIYALEALVEHFQQSKSLQSIFEGNGYRMVSEVMQGRENFFGTVGGKWLISN